MYYAWVIQERNDVEVLQGWSDVGVGLGASCCRGTSPGQRRRTPFAARVRWTPWGALLAKLNHPAVLAGAAGRTVDLVMYPGLPHGFFAFAPEMKASEKWRLDTVKGMRWLLNVQA